MKGLSAYESLRKDYLAQNPSVSEQELFSACIKFANVTGLILRQRILESQSNQLDSESQK